LEGFTESLRKEMSPEWNIQATIIQPGGFNTEWRNMTTLPLHPAYDTDNSPTKKRRSMLMGTETTGGIPFIGSPEKAAKAFITLSKTRKDLPLRVQLGSDSLANVRYTAMKTISDGEKLESVSHSTNVDGIDSNEYTKNLLAALG
jgi:NAD(P)-dependent dehydrogenase (short-subunit alcohol dehydrogenase family)